MEVWDRGLGWVGCSQLYLIFGYQVSYQNRIADKMSKYPRRVSEMQEAAIDRTVLAQKNAILKQVYRFPASRNMAERHRVAIKCGNSTGRQKKFCPCCLKGENNLPISMCSRTFPNNISRIGTTKDKSQERDIDFAFSSGSSMFFFFIKMLVVFLLLHISIVDAYNIITSLKLHTAPLGTHSRWLKYSILSKISQLNCIQTVEILTMVAVIVSIVYFIIINKIRYYIQLKVDMAKQTEDDYAIFVENIPIIGRRTSDSVHDMQVDYDGALQKFFMYKICDWLDDESHWYETNNEERVEKGPNTIQYDYKHDLGLQPQDYTPKDIIKSICLCYDVGRLQRLEDIRSKLMNEHLQNSSKLSKWQQQQQKMKNEVSSGRNARMNDQEDKVQQLNDYNNKFWEREQQILSRIPKQIQMINQSQLEVSLQMAADHRFNHQVTHFVGAAFISFKYQHYRDKILELADMKYDKKSHKRREKKITKFYKSHQNISQVEREFDETDIQSMEFQGSVLEISQASHPTEVLWKNLSISESDRSLRRIFSWILITLILLFSFLIILLISVGTNLADSLQSKFFLLTFSLSILSALAILIINSGLSFLMYYIIDWQRYKTISEAKKQLAIRLVAAQFINSALIYYFVALVSARYEIGTKGDSSVADLLIDKVSILFVVNGAISVLVNLVFLEDVFKRLIYWWKYTRNSAQAQTNGQDTFYPTFQIKLNEDTEHPEFDFAYRYSFYISQVYTASFYAYLVPIAMPVLALTFICHYWVDKFNLLKRSSVKHQISPNLTKSMFQLLQISVLIYAVGAFLFSYEIHERPTVFTLVAVIISAAFLVISRMLPRRLLKILYQSYTYREKTSYDTNVQNGKLVDTYWNMNPVTYLINEKSVVDRNKTRKPGMTGGYTNGLSNNSKIMSQYHRPMIRQAHLETQEDNPEQSVSKPRRISRIKRLSDRTNLN